jgi:hypothetical protein
MAADVSRQPGLQRGEEALLGPVLGRLAGLVLPVALVAGCDDGDGASSTRPAAGLPPVPSTLADGSRPAPLPAAVRRFRGRPVLGAKELPERSAWLRSSCRGLGEKPKFSTAWLSTEGLTVLYVVRVGRSVAFACDAVWADDRWVLCGGGSARSRDPRRVELAGGGLNFCFRPGGEPRFRPFMWIAVPAETNWVLVDHYSYWVAYRAAGRRLLRISGLRRAPDFRVKVAFFDQSGQVRREREARGYVAG